MKIISWNVNGLRANIKKGAFDWLVSQDADIFCVQETKAHPEQLPENVINVPGYHSYFDHSKMRKGYSGVAIWTKKEPEKAEYGLGIPEFDKEGRQIALFFKDFVFINIYFPNGGGEPARFQYKLDYYEAFLKYIEKLHKKGHKIIFCGDVNVAHNEIDLARPKENSTEIGFLPIERAWIDKVISKGYVDTYRHFNPEKKDAYTWWDMKTFARDRNVGWRIDYFFVSDDLTGKVKKTHIYKDILGSDHCPISIDLS
ncbi:MAG TPA: exodeoxyribonuclease III [Candidatus Paceibacterota bacterium]|nr:exodeoxyribonuclease III [Candidatus Paceibacterota bacterium]